MAPMTLNSDPLTPGPGARRLVKVSSTGTESSDDFEERDPGEAGSGWGRAGRWGGDGPGLPDLILPQTWEMGLRTGQAAPSGSGLCPAQLRPTDCGG